MASLPDPLYVLLTDNRYFRVDHAASITNADVTYGDGTNYRDELSGGYVGGSNLSSVPTSPPYYNGYNAAFEQKDDVYNHTAPRANSFTRKERQFIGATRSITGTTVSGNATVTVPDSSLFAVGQSVSGTGIDTGSVVSKINSATIITLSLVATGSGTVTLSVGNGTDVLARCWVDEFVAYSAYPPQQMGRTAILWPSA